MFLEEEWGITVNQSTISRLLKQHRISNKKGQRIGHT
jgi:arginine repressor